MDWSAGSERRTSSVTSSPPRTPHIRRGSTQTMSAVLLGICAEQGQLNIDAPITAG